MVNERFRVGFIIRSNWVKRNALYEQVIIMPRCSGTTTGDFTSFVWPALIIAAEPGLSYVHAFLLVSRACDG